MLGTALLYFLYFFILYLFRIICIIMFVCRLCMPLVHLVVYDLTWWNNQNFWNFINNGHISLTFRNYLNFFARVWYLFIKYQMSICPITFIGIWYIFPKMRIIIWKILIKKGVCFKKMGQHSPNIFRKHELPGLELKNVIIEPMQGHKNPVAESSCLIN